MLLADALCARGCTFRGVLASPREIAETMVCPRCGGAVEIRRLVPTRPCCGVGLDADHAGHCPVVRRRG